MKTSWFKGLAAAAVAAFTFGFAPSAQAESVSYLEPVYKTAGDPTSGIDYWETKSVGAYTEVTSGMTEWTEGWYVVEGNVGIEGRITCLGDVRLILKDGATLNANAGITVSGDANALTVYAQSTEEATMGTLVATSAADTNAGIGGASGVGQNITINGGIVTATGGANGAGIGGGAYSGAGKAGHDIVINGGKVTARCINGSTETQGWAAGIGGGDGGSTGEGYNITINGGDVLAYNGGGYGAGIGGGSYSATAHDITINGGTVRANVGSNGGSAIGAGSGSRGASRIKISTRLITKADNSQSPTTVIENTGGDLATSLKGKRYATVMPSVEVVPTPVEHATATVFTADGAVIKGPPFNVEKNTMVMVVYTAEDGYAFGGGASSYETEAFKADTDPTPMPMDPPKAPTAVTTGVEYLSPVYVGGVVTNGINLWVTCKVGSYTTVTDQTTWGAARKTTWYVVEGEVAIDSRITCVGDVRLILKDGATLTANAGITVTGDANALTVYAQSTEEATMGALVATSAADTDAGIGGAFDVGQNITINGGIITATGGKNGAGIGGGGNASVGKAGHDIVINGGKVTARCLNGSIETEGWAAGIGGGDGGSTGEGYNITINGGDVLAYNGGGYGAGIGAGSYLSYGHDITINGGTVRANVGSSGGSAIGGAMYGTASGIKISTNLVTKAGDAPSPQTVIENTGDDLAGALKGQRYATVTPIPTVVVTLAEVANATAKVYTNGVEVALSGEPPAYNVYSNQTDTIIIYTANPGYAFPGGATTYMNHVDTSKNPTELQGGEEPPKPPTPALDPVEYLEPVYKTAGDPTSGIDRWETKSVSQYTEVTSTMTQWGKAGEANWYVVAKDVQIDGGVTCKGYVNLILADGAKLTVMNAAEDAAGITTDATGSFTVYGQSGGTGAIEATGVRNGAGIGGGYYKGGGSNITINGGSVIANGGQFAAGIGGGYMGKCEYITINGGTVTANGGYYGAGIGGCHEGNGSYITINGGTVTATSGSWGAGIGGGDGGTGSYITINGGSVIAKSSNYGAGVGGGYGGSGSYITINGGTVTATGSNYYGAGIGGGQTGAGQNIAINGGTVNANGGSSAAGIGGGYRGKGEYITINGTAERSETANGCTVTANGGWRAAGIGGGQEGAGSDITINGGTVEVTGGEDGAGIGGGLSGTGSNITISNATVFVYVTKVTADCIGSGTSGVAASGVVIDSSAKVFFNLADRTMPASFEGFTIMTPETQSVERVLVGGIASWTAAKTFNLTNAVTAATGTITVNDETGVVFANKILKLPHDEEAQMLKLTVEDPPPVTEVEYLEPVYKTVGVPTSGIDHWETKSVSDYVDVKDVTPEAGGERNWGKANEKTWYVVSGDVTYDDMVICNGDVNLILTDGCTLTVTSGGRAGVCVNIDGSVTNTLTIYGQREGTGKLEATGGQAGAGIGSRNEQYHSGPITINGGVVAAKGGAKDDGELYAAGIGGGSTKDGDHITINGGTVTANGGGKKGAGIGGGRNGVGRNITINGGTVTATGGNYASGIGGGDTGNGENITINGGKVNAYTSSWGAALGGGGGGGVGKNIRINGGTVFAGATHATAIGSGSNVKTADGIYVSQTLLVKADDGNPPTTVIENTGADLTGALRSKHYAMVEPKPLTVEVVPAAVDHATATVFTADGAVIKGPPFIVETNTVVTVVYTAEDGYAFGGGESSYETEAFTADTNPTPMPVTPPAQPTVVTTGVDYLSPVYVGGIVTSGIDHWETCKVGSYTTVADQTTWGEAHKATWYVVEGNVTINGRIACVGDVRLILRDGATLNANAGITVTGDANALTVYAQSTEEATMGALEATGGANGSGIGGLAQSGSAVGQNITINGGIITATGSGTGIGGGGNTVGGVGKDIVINGGKVAATCSRDYGAGIGGGGGANGEKITINGGTVEATGHCGAGIGGGGNGVGADITVNGGTVTATGGGGNGGGAGIGGGDGNNGQGRNITINGGTVTATGGNSNSLGSGIGNGGRATTAAVGIYISTSLVTKADVETNPPVTEIVNTGDDLATSLKGQRYATVEPMPPVTVTPAEVANSVAHVYTNGVEVALSGEPPSCNVYSNQTDTIIVYTANPGYEFAGGATAYTNNVDTAKNPTELQGGEEPPKPPTPAVTPVEYLEPVYKTAGDPTSGIDHWETKSVSTYTVVSDQTTWGTAGQTTWYVVEGDVAIASGIACVGDVRLILKDGATLNASASIAVTGDANALTVYAQSKGAKMGTLTATGSGAGIGGGTGSVRAQNITINGGKVTAKCTGQYGAGIGGGGGGSAQNIVINGGTVEATGHCGAGIGGGGDGVGEDITINGGKVTAIGAYTTVGSAAGIGGGDGNNGQGRNIRINGGTVMAIGGNSGVSGIGSGGRAKDAAVDIYISPGLTTKADGNNPPETVIVNTGADLAGALKGQRYATVTPPTVEVVPKALEHATAMVYYADGEIVKGPPFNVETNEMVTVVYTAEDGYAFEGGASSYETDAFKAATNPTPMPMDPPAQPAVVTTGVEYRSPVYVGGIVTNGIDHWETCKVGSCTTVTDQTTWGEAHETAWYVVEGNVTINGRITCAGDVRLILADGATLNANAGIAVSGDSNALTIYGQMGGTGTLVATSAADSNAGIGGTDGVGQNITINGGIVTARGNTYAAGIGGGGPNAGHDIVINGGTVTAKSANAETPTTGWAAGIGGGDGGMGYNIVINGGTVNASGFACGAGIGGGGNATGHDIVINGGDVTAESGSNNGEWNGAGIGGGCNLGATNIRINGGTVKAIGGGGGDDPAKFGSGIGGGRLAASSGITVDTRLITKADVDVNPPETPIVNTGDDLASALKGQRYATVTPPPVEYLEPVYKTAGEPTSGIDRWETKSVSTYTVVSDQTAWGTAGQTNWYVVAENVTISDRITCVGDVRLILKDGATLTANGGITASGDTTGYLGFTVYAQSAEEATMGVLVATSAADANAGIGGALSEGQNITINGGIVTATGGKNGAGIGGGGDGMGDGKAGHDIVINGGKVTARCINGSTETEGWAAGIGGGDGGTGGEGYNITINGGDVLAYNGGGYGAGIGGGSYGAGAHDITINGGTVRAHAGSSGGSAIGGTSYGTVSGIKISTLLVTKADGNNPPQTVIENTGGDLADALKGQCYATVTLPTVEVVPTAVDHATATVFTADGAVIKGPPFFVETNTVVTVVYTAEDGYVFEGGESSYETEAFTADANPTPMPVTPPAQPTVVTTGVDYLSPVYIGGIVTNGIDHWVACKVGSYTTVADQTTWGEAHETTWYVVEGDVTINGRITCLGDVRLILKDGATLNANAGITVSGDANALTVYAQSTEEATMGALVATGGSYGAGIGGRDADGQYAGQNITINGGWVTAESGSATAWVDGAGAGIGGVFKSPEGSGFGQDIVINGGHVKAVGGGGGRGAGIGGGGVSVGRRITINGGTVEASSSMGCAGIGGGGAAAGEDITINGGTVTAIGGGGDYGGGAGIGGGDSYGGQGRNIRINGGIVTAMGGADGASGIGNGGKKETADAYDIFISTILLLKADNNNPPQTMIENAGGDLAGALKGRRYATVEPLPTVVVTPQAVDHATAKVYTNGVEVMKTGEPPAYNVYSNTLVTVRYTAEEGYYFEDEKTTFETGAFKADKDPVEVPQGQLPKNPLPAITDVTALQRYPWNGMVDIAYTLSGDMPENYDLNVLAKDSETGAFFVASTLEAEAAPFAKGPHTLTWDMNADGHTFVSPNVTFTVMAVEKPDPADWTKTYVVVDLSKTPYTCEGLDEVPEGGWTDEHKTTKLVLRRIEPGTFTMGDGTDDDNPKCSVMLTMPYYIGVFPVTGDQYEQVTGTKPSKWGGKAPVERVSWDAITASDGFLDRIVSRTGLANFGLPTEAQWEYACRAGTQTTYYYGDTADTEAETTHMWYKATTKNVSTVEVGTAPAELTAGGNPWGLYDMHGDVFEWCSDWYDAEYYGTDAIDPQGPDTGTQRVIRGGAWNFLARHCTAAFRGNRDSTDALSSGGFRVVRTLQTSVGGASEPTALDLRVGAVRDATFGEAETLTYTTNYPGGATVDITVNGETLASGLTGSGTVVWTPSVLGTNELHHIVKSGTTEITNLVAKFFVTGIQVGDAVWALVQDGVCTIGGTGDMWNRTQWPGGKNPLANYQWTIKELTVTDGVTGIGSEAFHKFYGLTNATFAASVTNVGNYAFLRCNSLDTLAFAGSDVTFGKTPFALHTGIYMKDGMPEVYPIPQVTIEGYTQKLYGSEDLKNWTEITAEQQKTQFHFFKIVLEKPGNR